LFKFKINNENKKENIDKLGNLKKNECLTAVLSRQIETVHYSQRIIDPGEMEQT